MSTPSRKNNCYIAANTQLTPTSKLQINSRHSLLFRKTLFRSMNLRPYANSRKRPRQPVSPLLRRICDLSSLPRRFCGSV